MRRTLFAGGLAVALSGAVLAQSIDEFDAWMRTIEERTQSVQQHISRRDADAVAADARALEEAFKSVEEFWVRRGDAPDAVALSKDARERAGGIAKAAADKNFEDASTQAIRANETCTACHRLYRPLP